MQQINKNYKIIQKIKIKKKQQISNKTKRKLKK